MYQLREIDAGSAYGAFYESAYPYGLDDDLPAASLHGVPVSTISRAQNSDGTIVQGTAPSSASATPGTVVVANLPQTQRVTIQQDYGNASNLPVNVTDADQVPLLKPSSRRVFLEIQNRSTSANTAFVAFGTTAGIGNGIEILPGGSVTFAQFVPQDDVHIACDTGGTATCVIIYCNKDEKE